ncbi:TPA: hypothetical protein QCO65_004152 [Bacillus cereus]|uniref:hypothetical protein n=1 Tax=Bacillus sp. FSL H8-0545 TaxID=2921402 RepID=UPI0030FCEA1D|nr:hypothetical protein [Bacillus cereus]HDR7612740.1 hypothetical protein [Bacillus mycoides]
MFGCEGCHQVRKKSYRCKGRFCITPSVGKCDETENIPYSVVRGFDVINIGDWTIPPIFSCEQYSGDMYPEDYTGVLLGLRTNYQIFAKSKSFYLIISSHFWYE